MATKEPTVYSKIQTKFLPDLLRIDLIIRIPKLVMQIIVALNNVDVKLHQVKLS